MVQSFFKSTTSSEIMPLNTAKIDDFSGGINIVDPPDDLQPYEYSDRTHDIEVPGVGRGFRARRGMLELPQTGGATLPIPSLNDAITNMKTSKNSGVPDGYLQLSTSGGKWYQCQLPIPGNTLSFTLMFTGTVEWDFVQATDNAGTEYVWAANGSDPAKKWPSAGGAVAAWGGPPPAGYIFTAWKNMMIMAGVVLQPQRLYFSAINNPESWPATNFIDIKTTDDDSDEITALEVVGENLLVFKRRSVWLVFDSVSFENRRIGDEGCLAYKCVAKLGDRVYFLNSSGFYSTDGDTIQKESKNIEPYFSRGNIYWPSEDWLGGTNMRGFADSRYDRLCVRATYDGKLMIFKQGLYTGPTFQAFPVLVLDTTITRPDKQHPWFIHGVGNSKMGQLGAAVRLIRRGPGSGSLNQPGDPSSYKMYGVLYDPVGPVSRIVEVFCPDQTLDAVAGGNSNPDARYFSRWIPLQGDENRERLRRVNLVGPQNFTVNNVSIYVNRNPGAAQYTVNNLFTSDGFIRVRPESRSRSHAIAITPFGSEVISSIELKYRGGKEH